MRKPRGIDVFRAVTQLAPLQRVCWSICIIAIDNCPGISRCRQLLQAEQSDPKAIPPVGVTLRSWVIV
jgi:hypothetical protein